MSSSDPVAAGESSTVLVVGDSQRASRTAAVLESAVSPAALSTASELEAAIDRLDAVDCVICEVDAGSGADGNGDGDATERSDDVSAGHGDETIRTLRAYAPDVPIIALVSNDGALNALEAGATDVISPDETDPIVVSRVRNATYRSRLERRSGVSKSAASDDTTTGTASMGDTIAGTTPADGVRYRALLEATSTPVLVLDEGLTFQWANGALAAWTGFTPDELTGTDLTRLVHPDDRDLARSTVTEIVAAELDALGRLDVRLRRTDGTWRRARLVVRNRIRDPSIEGVVVTVEPAGHRPAEDAVDVIERIGHPIFALDADWAVTVANEATARLLDRSPVELEGVVLWELLPESTVGQWYERLEESVATASTVAFEVDHPTVDGRLSVRAHPSESGVSVAVRERDRPASTVDRRRLDRVEAVVNAIDDAVFVVEDGSVAIANAATFDLVDADVVVGRSLESLFDTELAARIADRTASPVRRLDPIEWVSDDVHLAITVVPLGTDESACVVRDVTDARRIERSFSSLSSLVDGLAERETMGALCETVVDATLDVLGARHVVCYRADPDAYRPVATASVSARSIDPPALEPNAFDPQRLTVDDTDDGVVALDPVRDLSFHDLATETDRAIVGPIGEFGQLVAIVDVRSDTGHQHATFEVVTSLVSLAIESLERDANRRANEREIASLDRRLDRLSTLLDRRRTLERLLVETTDREEFERRVCEHLCELEAVDLAWIGEPEGAGEVDSRTRAGPTEAYLDDVDLSRDPDPTEPVVHATASRETTLVETVDEDALAGRGGERDWRRVALAHDLQSVVAVPIVHSGFVYGAFGVYARQPDAFDDDTRAFLEGVGTVLALAIDAHEAKRALLADEVVELELTLEPDDATALVPAIAFGADCAVHLESVVPSGADRSTVFFRAEGTTSAALLDALDSADGVVSARALTHDTDEIRFEVVVEGPTVAEVLVDHGGLLRTIDAVDERATLLVELPSGSSVRSFVTTLRERFPDVELIARRGRQRSRRGSSAFRSELDARLTERQQDVLRAAYFGGFFEWPRERTGEEVAESLDISQPTFNRHFRAAERTLYEFLFEEV